MAKSIVFGGEGFIGKHLVDDLLEAGDEVTVFSRKRHQDSEGGVRYIFGDFMNANDIEQAIQGQEYVYHFITLTNPAISDLDPYVDIETNVKMSVHLLESCVKNGIKRVIFPSSGGSIYGNTDNVTLRETDAAFPISPYAIGKQSVEGYLRYFNTKFGLDYLTFRVSNVYGEGQNTAGNKHGVIPVFLQRVLAGEPVQIYGDGSMVRDYIYVKDFTRLVVKVAKLETKHHLYNVGSGVGDDINEILTTIETVTGRNSAREYKEAPATYVQKVVLDCRRALEEFGEFSSTPLSTGIRNMYYDMNKEDVAA